MKAIGTTSLDKIEDYLKWYRNFPPLEAKTLISAIRKSLPYSTNKTDDDYIINQALGEMTVSCYGGYPSNSYENKYPSVLKKVIEKLLDFRHFEVAFAQTVYIGKWTDDYAYLYLGNQKHGVIIFHPSRWLEKIPLPDYSNVTPYDLRTKIGLMPEQTGSNLIPSDAENLTHEALKVQLDRHQDALTEMEKLIDEVQHEKTGELAELRMELEQLKQTLFEKKEAMMAELNEKKRELEEQKEKMECQIYLLDAQIYSIRCYAGEVVSFTKIKSGLPAAETEPIVIHQKLRFLDEELGVLASLYQIQWDEIDQFDLFLRCHPEAVDLFCPNPRCVVLIRLSRNGVEFGISNRQPYTNLMQKYDYIHGETVGIMIRNGENLYLGWTDEDRVRISDDLILDTRVRNVQPEETQEFLSRFDREREEKKKKEQRRRMVEAVVSRTFIYNILQGVVDHSNILPLPKGIKLDRESPYVQYSIADRWLKDKRFGSFSEIIAKANKKVQKGDILLMTQRLIAEHSHSPYESGAWDNIRGRGAANRTHDVVAKDCTMYPVNLIEYDEPIRMVKIERQYAGIDSKPFVFSTKEDSYQSDLQHSPQYAQTDRILAREEFKSRHVYISLEKQNSSGYSDEFNGYFTSSHSYANFEVLDHEFINLTHLNSVMIKWVITTRELGELTVGGEAIDYAYIIRYLKTALDYLTQREVIEKRLLDAIDRTICEDPDWPMKLTEWKEAHGIRKITAYQAKRFVNSFNQNS